MNGFSLETSDESSESRASSRGNRFKNLMNWQLMKERDAIGPDLRQKYKLDIARKATINATARISNLREQMKENFVVIFPDPQV